MPWETPEEKAARDLQEREAVEARAQAQRRRTAADSIRQREARLAATAQRRAGSHSASARGSIPRDQWREQQMGQMQREADARQGGHTSARARAAAETKRKFEAEKARILALRVADKNRAIAEKKAELARKKAALAARRPSSGPLANSPIPVRGGSQASDATLDLTRSRDTSLGTVASVDTVDLTGETSRLPSPAPAPVRQRAPTFEEGLMTAPLPTALRNPTLAAQIRGAPSKPGVGGQSIHSIGISMRLPYDVFLKAVDPTNEKGIMGTEHNAGFPQYRAWLISRLSQQDLSPAVNNPLPPVQPNAGQRAVPRVATDRDSRAPPNVQVSGSLGGSVIRDNPPDSTNVSSSGTVPRTPMQDARQTQAHPIEYTRQELLNMSWRKITQLAHDAGLTAEDFQKEANVTNDEMTVPTAALQDQFRKWVAEEVQIDDDVSSRLRSLFHGPPFDRARIGVLDKDEFIRWAKFQQRTSGLTVGFKAWRAATPEKKHGWKDYRDWVLGVFQKNQPTPRPTPRPNPPANQSLFTRVCQPGESDPSLIRQINDELFPKWVAVKANETKLKLKIKDFETAHPGRTLSFKGYRLWVMSKLSRHYRPELYNRPPPPAAVVQSSSPGPSLSGPRPTAADVLREGNQSSSSGNWSPAHPAFSPLHPVSPKSPRSPGEHGWRERHPDYGGDVTPDYLKPGYDAWKFPGAWRAGSIRKAREAHGKAQAAGVGYPRAAGRQKRKPHSRNLGNISPPNLGGSRRRSASAGRRSASAGSRRSASAGRRGRSPSLDVLSMMDDLPPPQAPPQAPPPSPPGHFATGMPHWRPGMVQRAPRGAAQPSRGWHHIGRGGRWGPSVWRGGYGPAGPSPIVGRGGRGGRGGMGGSPGPMPGGVPWVPRGGRGRGGRGVRGGRGLAPFRGGRGGRGGRGRGAPLAVVPPAPVAPVGYAAPVAPRRNVHRMRPIRSYTSRTNRAMAGMAAWSKTPELSFKNTAPGRYTLRAFRGVTKNVRTHLRALIRRAPNSLWVDGKKMNKKQAFSLIVDLLNKLQVVQVALTN